MYRDGKGIGHRFSMHSQFMIRNPWSRYIQPMAIGSHRFGMEAGGVASVGSDKSLPASNPRNT